MTFSSKVQLGFGVFLLAFVGCTPPPARNTHDADVRSIAEAEVLWVRHWRLHDAERVMSHYAEDATLMLPNQPPALGREAIREAFKEIVRDGNFSFTFDAARVEVARSGDYGYVQGSYALRMTDFATKKAVSDEGSFLRVYRKQLDGAWRVVQDTRASRLPGGPVPELSQ
ncbi:MAG: DUF4440 domain-containing protein [Candidatus Solibacter sp.]